MLTVFGIFFIVLISFVHCSEGEEASNLPYRYPNFHKTAPPIYWINLDSDIKRRSAFEKHLDKLGARNHTRISAIKFDGTSGYKVQTDDKFTTKFGWDMRLEPCTIKEFSVTVTHILAIKKAVNDADLLGKKYAMILEDDVFFSFDIDFDKMIESAPRDFSILQLETCNVEVFEPTWKSFLKKSKGHVKPTFWQKHQYDRKSALSWGLQGYIINTEIIKKRRAFYNALQINEEAKTYNLQWMPFELAGYCSKWKRNIKYDDESIHFDPKLCCNEINPEMNIYINMFPPTYLSKVPMMKHGSFESEIHADQDQTKQEANRIMNQTIFYPIRTGAYNDILPSFLYQTITS